MFDAVVVYPLKDLELLLFCFDFFSLSSNCPCHFSIFCYIPPWFSAHHPVTLLLTAFSMMLWLVSGICMHRVVAMEVYPDVVSADHDHHLGKYSKIGNQISSNVLLCYYWEQSHCQLWAALFIKFCMWIDMKYLHRFRVNENGTDLLFALWINRTNWARNCNKHENLNKLDKCSSQLETNEFNELTSLLFSKTIFLCFLVKTSSLKM